jgi:uncharacterized protein
MKYLLLLALLAALFFFLGVKRGRPRDPDAPPPPRRPESPKAMLRCVECGMHLPVDEALPGRGGVFCCNEHRSRFEARG